MKDEITMLVLIKNKLTTNDKKFLKRALANLPSQFNWSVLVTKRRLSKGEINDCVE